MKKRTFYKGITLVETIVTVGIFSLVMLGSSLFFVRMWRIHSFTMEMGVASFVASRGIEKSVENIRRARQAENGAFPIVQADDHDLTFYEDYDEDGKIERVHYFVDDQKFKIGITEPDFSGIVATYPSGDQIVKEAANYIVNENVNMPTFEYYDENGMIFAYDDVATSALSTPAIPSDIKMVKILLFVNPDPLRAPNNVRIQSFVVIRNLTKFDELPT